MADRVLAHRVVPKKESRLGLAEDDAQSHALVRPLYLAIR
jgi:hypothetical protein